MVNGKAVEGILQWLGHAEKKGTTTRRRKKDAEDTGEEPRPKVGRATKELVDNALKEARQEQLRGGATTRNALRFGTQEVAPKTAPASAPASTARPTPPTEGAKKRPAAAAVQALRSIARAGVSANTPPKRRAPPMPTKAKPRCEEESSESSAPAAAADSSEESSDGEDETEVASPSQTAASSSKKAPRPVVVQEEKDGLQASDNMKIDPKRITEVRSPTGATFQDAVLERLKTLCGDIDDATVLSEYVVVMCAGNKSREEMVGELVPFFSDKGQAQAFIQWVEECKWKFLIGLAGLAGGLSGASVGPPANRPAEVQPAAGPKAKAAHVESPSAPGQAKPQAASAQKQPVFQQHPPAPVQPGPHVAVTSKCVLQPNPQFEGTAGRVARMNKNGVAKAEQQQHLQATSVFTQAQPAKTARARAAVTAKAVEDDKHPVTVGPAFSKAATVAKVPAAKMSGHAQSPGKQKTDLLESMTKQLQLILTKLNDQGLTDEVREKYQSMAQTLQAQMTKITKPAVGKGRR